MEPVTLLETIENLQPARRYPRAYSLSESSQAAAITAQYSCSIFLEEPWMDGMASGRPECARSNARRKELRLCENVPATGMPVPSRSAPFNNLKQRETDRCASRKLLR